MAELGSVIEIATRRGLPSLPPAATVVRPRLGLDSGRVELEVGASSWQVVLLLPFPVALSLGYGLTGICEAVEALAPHGLPEVRGVSDGKKG